MRVISVGYDFENKEVINCNFSSGYSFLNCDVLYINLSSILSEYEHNYTSSTYMGFKNLSDSDSVAIQNDIKRRKNEIIELLKMGKSIFISICEPQQYYRATGEKQYSGTGRNRATTRVVTEGDIFSFLPIEIDTVKAIGSEIEFRGEDKLRSYTQSLSELFYFEAYIENPIGKPFLFIKGTNKVVASHLQHDEGHIFFIPTYFDSSHYKTKKEYKEVQDIYISSMIELTQSFRTDISTIDLPMWTQQYYVPTEREAKEQLYLLEAEFTKLQQKIDDQNKNIQQIQDYKLLFTESGLILEKLVGRILNEIGFSVTEGIPGRDDLILQYQDKIAVVEVKGVSKSAAEKHAAQLEKWVNEFYTTKGIFPKGILIVNGYRDKTLIERTEDIFPSQMIGYSQRRGHCLISTLQLLCIYFDVKDDEEKRNSVIMKILNTEGIFEEYLDWKLTIEQEH